MRPIAIFLLLASCGGELAPIPCDASFDATADAADASDDWPAYVPPDAGPDSDGTYPSPAPTGGGVGGGSHVM